MRVSNLAFSHSNTLAHIDAYSGMHGILEVFRWPWLRLETTARLDSFDAS